MSAPRHVYVIGGQSGPQKIGISADPTQRLQAVQSHSPEDVLLHHQVLPDVDARLVERVAHQLLRAKRLRGEWFDVEIDEAVAAIEQAVALVEADGEPSAELRGLAFKLPGDLLADFDAIAQAEGRSRTKQIEMVMRQFVQDYQRRERPAA